MDFLERDVHLEQLHLLLGDALNGTGRMALVSGEAGIGKSSLVRAFSSTLSEDVRFALGSCDPLDTPRPLGPLIDVSPALGRKVTDLIQAAGDQNTIFRAVLESLQTNGPPFVIAVEDIHWADEATLDFLRFLGRRIDDLPVLFIVTYRDELVSRDHPLLSVLGGLATSRAIQRLRLDPLSVEAVRTLANESTFDPEALHRRTRGNPFYVTEILDSDGDGIPDTVRDAVLARASRLSPSARAVLDAAAVIGASIPAEMLIEIAQAEAHAIDECLATGVLVDAPRGFAFRHELARETLLEALPSHRKLTLNRMALASLEARRSEPLPDDLPVLATYADEAGDRDAVLRYAPPAARRASQLGAHREAASQYLRAIRWVGEGDPMLRAELLKGHAMESLMTDNLRGAISSMSDALELDRASGDTEAIGQSLSRLGSWLYNIGDRQGSYKAVAEAVRLLGGSKEGEKLAQAYSVNASILLLDWQLSKSVEVGLRAIELAKRHNETGVLAHALSAVGSAKILLDDDDGIEMVERSIELAIEAGIDMYVTNGYINLGFTLAEMHRFELAREYLEQGIEHAISLDIDFALYYMRAWLSLVLTHQGEWGRASAIASSIVRSDRRADISQIMAWLALARLRTRRGDPQVTDALSRADSLAASTGSLRRIAPVAAASAEHAILQGNEGEARRYAGSCYSQSIDAGHSWFAGELAYWKWVSGEQFEPPGWVAEPYLLQIRGDWRTAARLWQEMGCPYESARALAEGDDESALREALATFTSLGAGPMIGRVQQRMRELGIGNIPRGPRPATKSNPAGFTPREVEVFELLVEGRTNSQMADLLYLSPRTIEHHVSSILSKLNVSSRVEAIQAAQRMGGESQSG